MTEEEKKVYECVKKNDDGYGLTADAYYNLYGSWNMPEFPTDMSKFDFDAALKAIESNQKELNMSEKQFERTLESLVEQGYVIRIDRTGGGYLYSAR